MIYTSSSSPLSLYYVSSPLRHWLIMLLIQLSYTQNTDVYSSDSEDVSELHWPQEEVQEFSSSEISSTYPDKHFIFITPVAVIITPVTGMFSTNHSSNSTPLTVPAKSTMLNYTTSYNNSTTTTSTAAETEATMLSTAEVVAIASCAVLGGGMIAVGITSWMLPVTSPTLPSTTSPLIAAV